MYKRQASDLALIFKRAEALISRARSAKVMAGKTHRSLADLQARSLTLDASCTEAFDKSESVAHEVATYSRQAGEALQALFSEEGRSEPFSPDEVSDALSRAAMSVFSLSSPDVGPLTTLAGRLRDLTDMLSDLASLPSDLDNTVEFERAPAPWVARANELKQTKITSIDTEAELARTLDNVRERDVVLKEKETELEEQSVRIEMLEARMKDASKRSAKIAELERSLHEARDELKNAKHDLSKAKGDAERDAERIRQEAVKSTDARKQGSAGDAALDDGAMGASARMMMKRQEHKISSLEGAIRYLKEENHRLRLPPPDAPLYMRSALDWLHEPLVKPKSERIKRDEAIRKEGKDAIQRLLQLASKPRAVDLTKIPENKLAWRPAKETARWRVENCKEDWEGWKDWRRDLVDHALEASSGNAEALSPDVDGDGK